MRLWLPTLGASTALLSGALAVASDSWDFALLPSSTAAQSLQVSYPLAGTFIGDYDATTNPAGTRTIPGLFGGSGNNPISYSSTVRVGDSINSHPAGTFTMALIAPGACAVSGFTIDLINGTPGTVTVDMLITYATFHTVAPSSIYPSLGAVTVPLANGSVTGATAIQSGPAIGTASLNGDGTRAITVAIPVLITVAGTAAGQPFPSDPAPAVLALTGTLTQTGSTATLVSSVSSTEPVGPLAAPPPLVNSPMSLPTIPPGTLTANLLVSGTFSDGSGTSTVNLALNAAGSPTPIMGDINGDGVVDGFDMTALISAWGATSGPADINGDGLVDGLDLTAIFSNWTH